MKSINRSDFLVGFSGISIDFVHLSTVTGANVLKYIVIVNMTDIYEGKKDHIFYDIWISFLGKVPDQFTFTYSDS